MLRTFWFKCSGYLAIYAGPDLIGTVCSKEGLLGTCICSGGLIHEIESLCHIIPYTLGLKAESCLLTQNAKSLLTGKETGTRPDFIGLLRAVVEVRQSLETVLSLLQSLSERLELCIRLLPQLIPVICCRQLVQAFGICRQECLS